MTFVRDHQPDAAIADFSKAIDLNPRMSKAFMDRGLAYASQHELRLASEDFSQAIQLNPKDAQAYMNRALVRVSCKIWKSRLGKILTLA